ncbi:FAD-dependent monooxygenase [Spirillospora sp. NPDC029432]|uniref:FAD-dependent oxidoreductase n=1 Tax=Spirillospora sp. NPDC029432 TaxID=3154599 RepID=UPI003456FBAB
MRVIGEHAVVLGAGMAGLLAARALSGAYERVTVVERDQEGPGRSRKGVPQGRHAHILLPRGQRVLEGLLPGLERELIEGGAVVADPGTDHHFSLGGHTLARRPGAERAIQAGRPFLERTVRGRVAALPGVAFAEGRDVVGLLTGGPGRITGVQVMPRHAGGAAEEIRADLVVDAMGRAGRTRYWLERLGHGPVPQEEIKVSVGYATRPIRLPAGTGAGKAVVVGPRPGRPRGMAMVAVEGDRYLLTVAGLGDRPPTDDGGFLAYACAIAPPEAAEAIRAAEPLGAVAAHRYASDLRNRYERVRGLPEGLVVLGDALCSFNPIYAQGMTVACLEAEVLRGCLDAGARGLAGRYFRAVARTLNVPWRMAVAADLAMPEVEGRRGLAVRAMNAYVERVQAAAARDTEVAEQFFRVIGLLDPPPALMRPSIVARSLRPAA